ncbi:hypothetical protein A3E39_04120 [Candidatus Uhrbacteria bacterium RIFCSPHIGHO2_12_FULL_60_25]|uniref:LytR/CpsA/Psr regulator C-terminal domain-containing protein n=1 Tax=Candidatus Uhrbacteria bacterium RIFCSPHIGHO2_12_FULL_60_25 TaxID=1802399 RepID=A0A1F7ULH9_9BACT|nr:MAG: hypothetical protein A3D73_02500 [Candidatus Uhrbacteria bacterium RIFCSPHIGHO2_02_FULL_60_44]OGL79121.1 MAG: hypothetical protein A3E39_04120 [Candidatus Uhrbacteria bacterium RIFCSPHIGHO2_12_FULL_60_25]
MIRKPPLKKSVAAPASTQRFFGQPVVILAVVAAMAVAAVYLWITQPKPPSAPPTAETSPEVKRQVDDIVARVAELITVNPNEKPYVAMVSDIEAVRQANPVFYRDAEEGDKVLIWSDKAVIYSPSKDKLVAVVTAQASGIPTAPQSATSTMAAEDATIEIRNGSGVAGAAGRLRTTLTDAGLTVSKIGDARTRPEQTLVIDLSSGKAPVTVQKTLELTGGAAGTVPDGEPGSSAGILVIIGTGATQ